MARSYDQEVAEHYSRIRHDPVYRHAEMLADMEAWSAPALSSYEIKTPTLTPAPASASVSPIPSELQSLRSELTHLMNKLNEHLDRGKPKPKKRDVIKGVEL